MNLIAFDPDQEKEFDANFISIYDSVQEKFSYYVHRLVGCEIEDENYPEKGAIWVPFINNKQKDWHKACEEDLRVSTEDIIEWKLVE